MNIIKQNKYVLIGLTIAGAGILGYKWLQNKSKQLKDKPFKFIKCQRKFLQDTQWFNTIDPSSLSNLNDFTTTNLNMDLFIDFKKQKIQGKIDYTVLPQKSNLQHLLFDIKCLKIQGVNFIDSEYETHELEYEIVSLEQHKETLGEQLKINLGKFAESVENDKHIQIQIIYETHNPENKPTAINWLTPEQTIGKKHPYLFTQSEPVFSRSIFPCQDSPSVKFTFQASLQVNGKLTAWCSGKLNDSFQQQSSSTYMFDQTIPIPAYLFALVAGNIECQKINNSERCFVITEPEFMEKSVKEFEDMELQITTIENYLTPYSWREFKVVVLPPSFPYGGMENPLLTFVSPSTVVGDKSQVSVIIHEMAHSWSGNLVSCKNWQNLFLNEGLTVFIEHKTNLLISGLDEYQILNKQREQDLITTINSFGVDHSFTSLQPDIQHANPDDSFSMVPYVKGCQFFMTLEKQLGDDKLFQSFLQSYFRDMHSKSVDFNDFLEYHKKFFVTQLGQEKYDKYIKSVDVESWVYKPGHTPIKYNFESETLKQVDVLVNKFLDNTEEFMSNPQDFKKLNPRSKPIFLQSVIDKVDQYKDNIKTKITRLNQVFNMNQYLTSYDIGVKWLQLAIIVGYEPTIKEADSFLGNMGRMKYLRPVYKQLVQSGRKDQAIGIFKKYQNFYHTIAAKMVQKDLGLI